MRQHPLRVPSASSNPAGVSCNASSKDEIATSQTHTRNVDEAGKTDSCVLQVIEERWKGMSLASFNNRVA